MLAAVLSSDCGIILRARMDKLFDAIVPSLPAWSVIPVAVILLFVLGWPAFHAMWKEIVPSYRLYAREKMRLELLKLLYEVEVLKKEHDLRDMESALPLKFRRVARRDTANASAIDKQGYLPSLEAAGFGMIGGSIVGLANIFIRLSADFQFFLSEHVSPLFWIGFAVGFGSFMIMGAVGGYLTRPRTRVDAMLRGAALPLAAMLVTTIFAGPTNSPQTRAG